MFQCFSVSTFFPVAFSFLVWWCLSALLPFRVQFLFVFLSLACCFGFSGLQWFACSIYFIFHAFINLFNHLFFLLHTWWCISFSRQQLRILFFYSFSFSVSCCFGWFASRCFGLSMLWFTLYWFDASNFIPLFHSYKKGSPFLILLILVTSSLCVCRPGWFSDTFQWFGCAMCSLVTLVRLRVCVSAELRKKSPTQFLWNSTTEKCSMNWGRKSPGKLCKILIKTDWMMANEGWKAAKWTIGNKNWLNDDKWDAK